MKKIFTKSLLFTLTLVLSFGFTKAQLLTSENFNFTGALSANGWAIHSGAPTNPISTTTGLTYAGLLGSGVGNAALVSNLGGQDENIGFASQTTDGQSIYTSMLVNVTDPATAKAGDYFFNLGDGAGTTFTFLCARLYVKITASVVNFGISNTSPSPLPASTYGTTAFAKNTTYLIIVKYTISTAGNDPVSLWVIPTGVPATEAAAGTPEVVHTSTLGQDNIRALALRQGSASNSVQIAVDAIKVGLTWADVTPSSSVPASLTTTGTIADFGIVFTGSTSASQSYNISGANLTGAPGNITVSAPSADFQVSNNNSSWGASTTIAYASSTLASTPVWVRFSPQSAGLKTGNVSNTGGGVGTPVTVAVSGTGVVPVDPTLSATSLAPFENVCTNTTTAPNSFTINATNLTTADVTVGPLAGYSFSTTPGGTYTPSLTLTQPGGTFTQQVFVQFNPVAVQSYNGNIVVAGGGASTSINVAASGAGSNNAPGVTTGSASAITTSSATLAGNISATGCTAVSAYGIVYSTTNGFPNGSGTVVASSNLAAGAFTASLTALAPSTVYYYRAYATNAGGTTYGTQQSFTTSSPAITATPLAAFDALCVNLTGGPNSFTISSTGLGSSNVTVAALPGYTYSTTANGTYSNSLSITQPGGAFSQFIFVKFTPTAIQSYSGNIVVGGGGANPINVAVSGSGVNTPAGLTTGDSSAITASGVTLAGSVTSNGCSNVTEYGIEYSGINNFTTGSGIKVAGSNISPSGNFATDVNGLVQGTTYYYRAYAKNSGGTSYGVQKSFVTAAIPGGLTLYSIPALRNTSLRFSVNNIKPDHYAVLLFNSNGQKVYRKDMIIQTGFINDAITVPGNLVPGVYQFQLENNNGYRERKTIMIK